MTAQQKVLINLSALLFIVLIILLQRHFFVDKRQTYATRVENLGGNVWVMRKTMKSFLHDCKDRENVKSFLQLSATSPEISKVDLQGSSVNDDDLFLLAEISGVEFLILSDTDVKGEAISDLSKLSNLKILSLNNCRKLIDVSRIHTLSHIEYLSIDGTDFRDISFQKCTNIPSLGHISLRDCLITKEWLESISSSSKIITLDLAFATFVDVDFDVFSRFTNLEQLSLRNVSLENSSVKQILIRCPSLDLLVIDQSSFSPEFISTLNTQFSALRIIDQKGVLFDPDAI